MTAGQDPRGDENQAVSLRAVSVTPTRSEPSGARLLTDTNIDANPVSLDAPHVSVEDRIALDESRLRIWVAVAIVGMFIIANGIVLFGVWFVFKAEVAAIAAKVYGPENRVVTAQLLMTIVGATTVQLGALTILMGKYVFPPPQK